MRAIQLFAKIWYWQNDSETIDDIDYVRGQGKVCQNDQGGDQLPYFA